MHDPGPPLWSPDAGRVARANLTRFMNYLREHGEAEVRDYEALRRWSVAHPERLWPRVAEFCGIVGSGMHPGAHAEDVVVGLDRMAPPDPELGPRWFPRARLNYAENLLRHEDDRAALVFWNERGRQRELSFAELREEVARVAAALSALGVQAGDRVAGWMPNMPETTIAMLAATTLGAIWSSCSPDFGTQGVLDRFGQIAPRVLFCADGYRWAGRELDCLERAREIVTALPAVERVVVVPYLRESVSLEGIRGAATWADFVAGTATDAPIGRFDFAHPLFIMYSSGTTGLPKCMVHSAGGTLIQHQKEHVLHVDLGRDDRIFYYTTCGWMMWNWLMSALAVGATVVLYDGAPMSPSPAALWDMAQAEGITAFGTSAKYLALLEKSGAEPARTHDLPALRTILSTGSPLAAHSFDYVYDRIKRDVHLANISGGTDLISCWVLGNPIGAVYRGECQVRGLGMAVEVWDEHGRSLVGEPGELVCTKPFPSMPTSFWNDPEGERYRATYFTRFSGAWTHGDWCELTPHGGMIIYGRSDATLNPGGVRIGTAELYRQVDAIDEVVESIAVAQEMADDVRIVLFVRLRDGVALDDALRESIRRRIRERASPRHVPAVIAQVRDIPRTISGKISELAVREVIHGRPVRNVDALANPGALEEFRGRKELA